MDVVMGNNGNVNVAHEVRRYVDVKSGFIPTLSGNVAHEVRRYEKSRKTKPVASGFIPDVKPGFTPDVKSGFVPVVPVASGLSPTTLKWDPSRRPSAKIGGEGGRSRR